MMGLACLVAVVAAAEVGTIVVVPVDSAGNTWSIDALAAATFTRGDETVRARLTAEGLVAELSPGRWTVHVTAPRLVAAQQEIEVRPGTGTFEIVLEPDFEGAEEMVVEERSEASELRRSAQAVTVVETEDAQKHAADLGEVMARTEGIGIRREGGLGSDTRFSLDGLTDDQIRFFLDGLPLELSGYPFGISNVPVDLVERIEVYRGVVPVRFGADALGGAVNLVSEQDGTAGSLGYQVGSFHTHRVAAHLRAASKSGLFADGAAYYDTSRNDYEIEVEVPDDVGRLSVDTVERFHDDYRAGGGALVLGLQDRSWADRLSVRGFASTFYDEIQHNVVMTVPYGEPTYEVRTRRLHRALRTHARAVVDRPGIVVREGEPRVPRSRRLRLRLVRQLRDRALDAGRDLDARIGPGRMGRERAGAGQRGARIVGAPSVDTVHGTHRVLAHREGSPPRRGRPRRVDRAARQRHRRERGRAHAHRGCRSRTRRS